MNRDGSKILHGSVYGNEIKEYFTYESFSDKSETNVYKESINCF